MRAKNSILVLSFLIVSVGFSQVDSAGFFKPSTQLNKKRVAFVVGCESALHLGSMVGLNALWYSNYPRGSFHFFNDNNEWLQMDKAGHMVTAYTISRVGVDMLKWSGVPRKKCIFYGGVLGIAYQGAIEVLDGYSTGWGFSTGDFVANVMGSAVVVVQELAWSDQRIVLKASYHNTKYAQNRPDVLGSNLQEKILKDYNGQTMWLSTNISSFIGKENKFPKWLNVAVGYGAEGMTGAVFNPPFDKSGLQAQQHDRYRKILLSLDVDLTRIPVKNYFLKTVFKTIGFIKIPAPTISFSEKGVKGYWMYF